MRRSVVLVALLAVVACGCGKINQGASPQGLELTSTTTTSSPSGEMDPPVPTTIIDPSTYHPSYDTIASLAADSTEVFIGTARPLSQDPTDGGTVASFSVDRSLRGYPLDTLPYPEIPEGQPGDLPIVVGQKYLVFWSGGNGQGETSCIVGGARGLFNYNAATQTVRRVATSPSQIPTSLTLSQVIAQLPDPNVPLPEVEPPPPICSPSVTGS
jgi:hypothetical protein